MCFNGGMTTSGWQAQINKTSGAFVSDPTEATAAVRRLVPDAGDAQPEDAEFGIFLIDLTAQQVADLQGDGFLHLTDGEFEINVEMP